MSKPPVRERPYTVRLYVEFTAFGPRGATSVANRILGRVAVDPSVTRVSRGSEEPAEENE